MKHRRAAWIVAMAAGAGVNVGYLGVSPARGCIWHAMIELTLNTSNAHGNSGNTTVNNAISSISADVQQVRYDASNMYVNATGIPSHPIGPWTGNPNIASNQNWLYRVPMSPQANGGTKTATSLGSIGFMVNGVPFFNASDGMSYQSKNIWHQNANVVEAPSFDAGMGHPQQTGVYHYHQQPALLRQQLGDDGTHHSPLLGFAFDGFPVYGPYGYANADGSGGVVREDSGYTLRNITTRTTLADGTALSATNYGPAVSTQYPLGYYLEDYQYTGGASKLDQYNGRFTITPEFPQGTYAYFTTLDSLGKAAYPYILGPNYNGVLQNDNRTQTVSVPASGVSNVNITGSAAWANSAGGLWCDSVNWSGGSMPNGVGTTATFATLAGVSALNISLEGPQRAGTLQIGGTTLYTLEGAGPLVMLAVGGSSVNVTAGSHTIAVPFVLGTSTTFNISTGASLYVQAMQQTGIPLTKTGGGTLKMTALSIGALTVSEGTLALDGGVATARRVTSLAISNGAKVDLADGKMIVTSATSSAIGALVKAGSITTSMSVAGSGLTGIGVATASETGRAGGTFAGVSVTASDVLLMYTYRGDANLDGKINVDDYGRIDSSIPLGISGWYNGDFNYDGKVNVDDYGIIDFNVGIQGAPFSAGSNVSTPLSAVPEPGSFSLFALLLARRRHRRKNSR